MILAIHAPNAALFIWTGTGWGRTQKSGPDASIPGSAFHPSIVLLN
jgi:hypothetical protein